MTIAGKLLGVALPDTVLEEQASLRDKTLKLGQIARTCSVFGVDVVQIFRDPRGRGESALIKRVLEYLETPQYLRRRLFPLDDSLRFAGLLPPLRIPSHKSKVPVSRLALGELREGVVLAGGGSVDVGLDAPVELLGRGPEEGTRVTVRISSVSPLRVVTTDRSLSKEYWGYTVEVTSIDRVLADGRFGLRVATSRMGDSLAGRLPLILEEFRRSKGINMVFGSPTRGLFEIVKNLREKSEFIVNLYPEQNTVTIRTEEAIASGLYLLEVLSVIPNTKV